MGAGRTAGAKHSEGATLKRIFAIDAEANGLWGQAFAIGAYVIDPSAQELARFTARCPIDGPVDPWVAENVLPAVDDLQETHGSYGSMLEAFYAFYMTWGQRGEADVIAHIAFPVETTLMRDVFTAEPGREWQGPFPLLGVEAALETRGHDPRSVEAYLRAHGIVVPIDASPHHPLYDAASAALCWHHLHRGSPTAQSGTSSLVVGSSSARVTRGAS
jgi:hypothetical protein